MDEVNEPIIQTVNAAGSDVVKMSYKGDTAIRQVKDWLELIDEVDRLDYALNTSRARVRELERYIADISIDNFKKRHMPK